MKHIGNPIPIQRTRPVIDGILKGFKLQEQNIEHLTRLIQPFSSCRRILTQVQETTFENTVVKSKMTRYELFLILTQCFQPYFIIIISSIDIFIMFD